MEILFVVFLMLAMSACFALLVLQGVRDGRMEGRAGFFQSRLYDRTRDPKGFWGTIYLYGFCSAVTLFAALVTLLSVLRAS